MSWTRGWSGAVCGNLEDLTNGKQKPFKGIDNWKLAASDHAAAWVDLKL